MKLKIEKLRINVLKMVLVQIKVGCETGHCDYITRAQHADLVRESGCSFELVLNIKL